MLHVVMNAKYTTLWYIHKAAQNMVGWPLSTQRFPAVAPVTGNVFHSPFNAYAKFKAGVVTLAGLGLG
jgi:hypothetical protein